MEFLFGQGKEDVKFNCDYFPEQKNIDRPLDLN
jgi:hypothetical protein